MGYAALRAVFFLNEGVGTAGLRILIKLNKIKILFNLGEGKAVSNAGIRYAAHSAMNFTLPLARLPVTVNV